MKRHPLRIENRDREGRRWCAVCGLPENNARARQMHSTAALPARARTEDWRDRAYRPGDEK